MHRKAWFLKLLLPVLACASAASIAAPLPPLPAPTESQRKACAKPGRTDAEVNVCLTPTVWAKSIVGAVQTGIDGQRRPIGRVFYLVVVGPDPDTVKQSTQLRSDLQKLTVNKIAALLRPNVDRAPSIARAIEEYAKSNPSGQVRDQIDKFKAQTSELVFQGIQATASHYRTSTYQLFKAHGVDALQFRLAVAEAGCTPASGCSLPGWALDDDVTGFDRYGKLLVWRRSNPLLQSPLTGFLASAAEPLAFGPMSQVRGVPTSTLSAEDQISALERLVADVRTGGGKYEKGFNIDASVPSLLELSPRSTLAMVDLLKSPVTGMHLLSSADTRSLVRVSDELARTRITECARLRGNLSPTDIGNCAGYDIQTAQEVAECMGGKRCFPKTGQQMTADALLIADRSQVGLMATAAALPRVNLLPPSVLEEEQKMQLLKQRFNACSDDPKNKAAADLATCLAASGLEGKQRATMDCAKSASGLKGAAQSAKLRECLLGSLTIAQQQQVACLQSAKQTTVDVVLCSSKDKVSPEAIALAECMRDAQGGQSRQKRVTQCMLDKQLPGVAQAIDCIKGNQSDWTMATACALKDRVGGDAGKALQCATENRAQLEATAVCMVSKSLPGDLGKAAQCLAQSGGDILGAAVCGAGDGLTVDQRIALQCASQSGGEPSTFGACLVGQMTMKELNYCKGKRFGEGKCFNENNEFREFFKNAGFPIGPKSVVADVINLHLQLFETQFENLSKLNEEVKKTLTEAARVLTQAHQAVLKAHEQALRQTEKAVKGACTQLAKVLFGKKKRC